MYIKQLPIRKQFTLYKAIKAALIAEEVYSYESLEAAMNSKVSDLPYEIIEEV